MGLFDFFQGELDGMSKSDKTKKSDYQKEFKRRSDNLDKNWKTMDGGKRERELGFLEILEGILKDWNKK